MRSFNRSMPEEVNRVVADALSGAVAVPDRGRDGEPARRGAGPGCPGGRRDGRRGADLRPDRRPALDALERLGLEQGGFIVAAAHRAGNVDDPASLRAVVDVMARTAEEAPVVFAVHPRTRARLESEGLLEGLAGQGIRATDPLGYLDITRLVRASRAVLTDSGGLQKEAFLASVPCVTMREETEWVETVESGWNRLVGLDADAAAAALANMPKPGERTSRRPSSTAAAGRARGSQRLCPSGSADGLSSPG